MIAAQTQVPGQSNYQPALAYSCLPATALVLVGPVWVLLKNQVDGLFDAILIAVETVGVGQARGQPPPDDLPGFQVNS